MLRKFKTLSVATLILIVSLNTCCSDDNDNPASTIAPVVTENDVLFQIATISDLMAGEYDGLISYTELSAYGDFGIGTFDGINGEMIMLDNIAYQIRDDGVAYNVPGSETSPFAMITNFETDATFEFSGPMTYEEFRAEMDSRLTVPSTFYALKVSGTFSYLQRRSVSRQSKPYPGLMEVVAGQSVYEEQDEAFTLVGYRVPDYMAELNSPGYHLHCIDPERSKGGHVLDFNLENVTVEIDYTGDYYMVNSN